MTTLLDLWRASRSVLRGYRLRRPDDRVQVTSLNAASMFASAVACSPRSTPRGARSSARPPGGTSGIVSVGAVRATHLRQRALRGAGRGDRPRVDEGGGDLAGHRRRLELSDGAGRAESSTVHRLSPAGQSARLPHRDRKASRRVRHRRDTDDLVYEVRTSGCTSPRVTASSTYMTKQRPVHPCGAPPDRRWCPHVPLCAGAEPPLSGGPASRQPTRRDQGVRRSLSGTPATPAIATRRPTRR